MKKLLKLSCIIAAGLVLAGCSNMEESGSDYSEESGTNPEKGTVVLNATAGDISVKSQMDSETGVISWSTGDSVSLFKGAGSDGGNKFVTSESGSTAKFNGDLTQSGDGKYWGIYPYGSSVSFDGTSAKITLPSVQKGVPGTFAGGQNLAIGCSDNLDMSFFNVCSWMRFTVSDSSVKSVRLTATGGETIAGDLSVSFDDAGKPQVTSVANGSSSVTLTPSSGAFVSGEWYYISIVPVTFSKGFVLSFISDSATKNYTVDSEITFKRSMWKSHKSADRSKVFDESDIVLSLAAISDVHINTSLSAPSQKFSNALAQLKSKAAEQDANGIDGVMVVGDLIDKPSTTYLSEFKTRYEAAFNPEDVPMIYTIGNHDASSACRWYSTMVSDVEYLRNGLGSNYFLTDQDQSARTSMECRHCIIDGYNILTISPDGIQPVIYDSEALSWLDTKLKAITDANPDKYVIVLTHPMIYNTVYGSLLGESSGEWSISSTGYWATHALDSILEKYPQAVVFGGHLHFPLNDPRSVWQGKFTALGCASTRYMAIENGGYENMASATTMKDKDEFSQGNLLQFDGNGNMRVFRMDFYHNEVIGAPLTMSFPSEDLAHLQKYSHTIRSMQNAAPETPTVEINTAGGSTSLTFYAKDDEFVHDYTITVTDGSSTVYSTKILTDFYLHAKTSAMATGYTCSLGVLDAGTSYTATIVARDSWGATSSVTKTFKAEEMWKSDDAGSMSLSAGDGSVSSDWLSYSNGQLSWTANGTGSIRKTQLALPDNRILTLVQLSPSDFKGTWTLKSKLFDPNNTIGTGKVEADVRTLTFGEPLVATNLTDDNGVSHTNNIGIKGLYLDSTMDASLEIDYDAHTVRLGAFCDRRSAQKANDSTWCVYLPECATTNTWSGYNFVPTDFSSNDYEWIWFTSTDNTYKTFKWVYAGSTRKLNSKYYILGISIVKATGSGSSTIGTSYDVIYQANYNGSNTEGMYFTKQ